MGKIAVAASLAGAVALAACSMSLPVEGLVENSTETFTGTATGQLGGGGTITITTNGGTVCQGDFVYTTRREGKGTFRCSDGRSGPFEFVSTGMRGTGTGDFGGQRFTFTFG